MCTLHHIHVHHLLSQIIAADPQNKIQHFCQSIKVERSVILENQINHSLRVRVANYMIVSKIPIHLQTMVYCHKFSKSNIRNPKEAIKANNASDIPFLNQPSKFNSARITKTTVIYI